MKDHQRSSATLVRQYAVTIIRLSAIALGCFLLLFAGHWYSRASMAVKVQNDAGGRPRSGLSKPGRPQVERESPYIMPGTEFLSESRQLPPHSLVPSNNVLDPTFAPSFTEGYAVENFVSAVQPDGKILTGGAFSFGDTTFKCCLTRLNADGTPDSTFNPGGTGANSNVYEIIVLPDGKILVGGSFTQYNGNAKAGIVRLNPDGTYDPTFNPGGVGVGAAQGFLQVQTISVHADGKIVLSGGGVSSYNGVPRNSIAQLNPDGTLDTTFTSPFDASAFVEEVDAQPDGKVLAGGSFTLGGRNSVVRLNADGTVDNTFGSGAGPDGAVYGMQLQPDGKVLIGGGFGNVNGTPRAAMARLNPDGTLDTQFVPANVGQQVIEYFAVQQDGKVLAAGFFPASNGFQAPVIRLNPDGSLDPTLDAKADNYGYQVTLQPDGKVIVTGRFQRFSNGEFHAGLARYNTDGALDSSLSSSLTIPGIIYTMARQSDGKLIVGGNFTKVNGAARSCLARLNPDGSFDSTFDTGFGGLGSGFNLCVYTVAIQPDGKILVGGNFSSFNGTNFGGLVRLNTDGSVDQSFALPAPLVFNAQPEVDAIEVLPDGKILIGGFLFNSQSQFRGLQRLNSDGSADATFNIGGTSANSSVFLIRAQPDGKFIIGGGGFTQYNGVPRSNIARINANGSLDTSFDPGTGAPGGLFDAELQPDGKIIIGGSFTTYNGVAVNRIARVNSDGSLDANFNVGSGVNNVVRAVLRESNGKVFVGGAFTTFNGEPHSRLVMLTADGSVDTEFLATPDHRTAVSLLQQPDGRLIVGGGFTFYSGIFRRGLARLLFVDPCTVVPITYGQSINGNMYAGSCPANGPSDLYTFDGSAGDEITISMDSLAGGLQPLLQLVAPDGVTVLASNSGPTNARIPALGYFDLPSNGTYTIVASTPFGIFGDYLLSLTKRPIAACVYSISPTSINVGPGGGTFFFDVIAPVGCPTVNAATGANSDHIQILSNTGGRVTYGVTPNAGPAERVGDIVLDDDGSPLAAGGQTHTINQFGITPPTNDLFAQAQLLPGAEGKVGGHNNNASAETGEPAHAGNAASRSVWYRWTAPTDGLYSFTTSGSSFDTVMAIYTGTAVGGLTRISENDDTTSFDATSKINFRATAGVEYSIAVDGKAGVSGTIQLSYSPYRRLFRLYLQTFNGFPSPITPDTVTALRQDGTGPSIPGGFISQGVYEFDLPDDNSPYVVTITGPEGITWVPGTYIIDNTSGRFDELMAGEEGGGQNQTTNPTNTIPKKFKGFINGMTQAGLAALRVQIATTGSTSAVPPADCPNPVFDELMRVVYNCTVQPNSTSQIVPNAPQTAFQVPVLNLPVLDRDTGPATANAITATASATYNISGHVLAGGTGLAGVDIDISTGSMSMRVTSDGTGSYSAPNLAPGQVYTIRAQRPGYIFQSQTVNLQAPGATVDIPALSCGYSLTGNGNIAAAGGPGEMIVTATTSQQCEWTAVRDGDWISLLSGSSVGNGSVQFSVQPNTANARQGAITVGDQSFTVSQASGCAFNLAGGVVNFPASGGSSSTMITATDAGCVWNAAATDYCMISGLEGPGVGEGSLSYTVSPNLGVARQATISVGGQTLTISQDAAPGTHRSRFDFDGDGRGDISVFRPSSGSWYLLNSTSGFTATAFGADGDIPAAADYDGDGRSDVTVFRPSSGYWYRIDSSNGNIFIYPFGAAGDIPVPADYDGDGLSDLAVYRPSTGYWYIINSSTGEFTIEHWGIEEDRPATADYDGDGHSDIAVFRPSEGTWYILNSTGGFGAVQFGASGDMPVAADYGTDGKADIAVYRPSDGNWYRLDSLNGAFTAIQFGAPEDIPVPADYNGDTTTDIAVYRPSTNVWYLWSCTNNPLTAATYFGTGGDVPVPR